MSIKTIAAAAALAMAVASPLYAQTAANNGSNNNSAAVNALQPGQVRVSKVTGAKVYGTANSNGANTNANTQIATVKDLIIGRNGRVAEVVLSANGRYVAVPMRDLQLQRSTTNQHLWFAANMTKNQLKSQPTFELNPRDVATGSSMPPANK